MKSIVKRILGIVFAVLILCAAAAIGEDTESIGEPTQEETILPESTDAETVSEENEPEEAEKQKETTDSEQTDITEQEQSEEDQQDSSAAADDSQDEEESPTWLSQLVKRLGKTKTEAWIAFGAIVAMFFVLKFAIDSGNKWNATMVSYGALSVALSFVLSYIRLPVSWSGSITPGSMLPIMFFSAAYGLGPGVVTGLIYGLLQFLQKPEFLSAWQFILDYLLSFSAIGLAGLAKTIKIKGGLYISIAIASLTRMVFAILAGIMWAYSYLEPGQEFLELEVLGNTYTLSPWPYSIVYNALYMIPETIICVVLAVFLSKPLLRILKGENKK